MILMHGANELVGQPLARAKRAKMAILVMEQSSTVGGSPEGTIPTNRKRAYVVGCHSGRVETGIDDEADTVKSCQPPGSANPQISVRCLSNRANSVFRKPILCSPNPAYIGSRLRKGDAGESQQQLPCAEAAPKKPDRRMWRSTLQRANTGLLVYNSFWLSASLTPRNENHVFFRPLHASHCPCWKRSRFRRHSGSDRRRSPGSVYRTPGHPQCAAGHDSRRAGQNWDSSSCAGAQALARCDSDGFANAG